ncbi:hypothetical protein MASR2M70_10280 [Bacillota bacterium]
MIRQLFSGEVKKIFIEFDRRGSFAASYSSQGTDRGLVGGMLGYAPFNPLMKRSLQIAAKKGILVEFHIAEFDAPHPNTARIRAVDENGETASAVGISTGGGIVEILNINGFPVSIMGGFYELLISFDEMVYKLDDSINKIKEMMGDYEFVHTAENGSKRLINIKTKSKVSHGLIKEIKELLPESQIKQIDPVYSILSRKDCRVPFKTAGEMMEWAQGKGLSPGDAGLYYEAERGGISQATHLPFRDTVSYQ